MVKDEDVCLPLRPLRGTLPHCRVGYAEIPLHLHPRQIRMYPRSQFLIADFRLLFFGTQTALAFPYRRLSPTHKSKFKNPKSKMKS